MAGSPPLRSSPVGGFVKSESAATSVIRLAKISDQLSAICARRLRRVAVPNALDLSLKGEREAAQFAVKIRRVSFVRVHSKQKAQWLRSVFPTLQASRSEVPPADRIDSHAEGGAGVAPL